MNLLILPAMGWVVSLLLFYKDGLGIKLTHEIWYAIKQRNQTNPIYSYPYIGYKLDNSFESYNFWIYFYI